MDDPSNRARFASLMLGAMLVVAGVYWVGGRTSRDAESELDAPMIASRPTEETKRAVVRTDLGPDRRVRADDSMDDSMDDAEASTSRSTGPTRAATANDRALLSRYCLIGRVEGPQGPVDGAQVQVFARSDDAEDEVSVGSARTSADGSYAVAVGPGFLRVVAISKRDGAGEAFVDVDVLDGLVNVATICLGSKPCIGGVVRNFGEPVEGWRVSCRRASRRSDQTSPESMLDESGNAVDREVMPRSPAANAATTLTDREGRYVFAPPEEGEYVISVRSEARFSGTWIDSTLEVEKTVTTESLDADFDLWWTHLNVTFTSTLGDLDDVAWEIRNPRDAVLMSKAIRAYRVEPPEPPRTSFEAWVECDEEFQIRATAPRHAVAVRAMRPGLATPTLDIAIKLTANFSLSKVNFRFLGDAEAIPPKVAAFIESDVSGQRPSKGERLPSTTERRQSRASLAVVDREAVWPDVEVEPGRYRITLYPGGSPFNSNLVLRAPSVELGTGRSPTVVVACCVGGRLRLAAVDPAAAFVAADCRIIAPDGAEVPVYFDINSRKRGTFVASSRSRPAATSKLPQSGPDLHCLPLVPGNYVVVFEHEDYELERVPCVVVGGETTEVRAHLRRRAR